jgi:ABC-type Fe3+-hydroxamate transport system substrate-binding protein
MPIFYDQLNRAVDVPDNPKRIVSLVPSQTELLYYLGLDKQIAGITKFCIHPADKVNAAAKIGGTKQLNIVRIHQLKPDLIIANKEENEREQVEELANHYPVWISDINDIHGALDMITKIGEATNKSLDALQLADDIILKFNNLDPVNTPLNVLYLIWRKPYMAAGKGTFINNMLQLCGFTNIVNEERYPELSEQGLIAANPDVLLLSSEPYPFSQKHVNEFKKLLPKTTVILVDGEMFSWYGSRLLHAPAYFKALIDKLKAM